MCSALRPQFLFVYSWHTYRSHLSIAKHAGDRQLGNEEKTVSRSAFTCTPQRYLNTHPPVDLQEDLSSKLAGKMVWLHTIHSVYFFTKLIYSRYKAPSCPRGPKSREESKVFRATEDGEETKGPEVSLVHRTWLIFYLSRSLQENSTVFPGDQRLGGTARYTQGTATSS